MTWGSKRKFIYIVSLLAFFVVIGFSIQYFLFRKEPTCFDNIKNGNEAEVDCGGSCLKICIFQVDKVSILWSRSFSTAPGIYNAVSYLENHNQNAGINKINYRFSFFDKDNIYIGKREGQAVIPIAGKFAIFEPNIQTGYSEPVFTKFEFTEQPIWLQVSPEKSKIKIIVSDVFLQDEDTKPRLFAKLKNNSFFMIPNINIIALLRNQDGNVINVSRTYIESLSGEESKKISFTWPIKFSEKVITKEIIPIFNIFSVK